MIGLNISVKDSTEEERATALDRMPTGWLETVGTVFDLALDNAPYKSIKRGIQRSYADYVDDEIIPMAELNEKYSSIGLTFMEDHKKGYVDILVQKRLDDMKKQDIISRGPQNIAAKTSYFISGLGGSFTDPINLGSSFVPVVGQARFLQMVGKYGKTSARFRRGLIEGGVGNTLFEPVEASMALSEQRDYGAMNSIYNIAFGSLLGGSLQVGFGKIGDVYKKYTGRENIYNDIENAPVDMRDDLIRYSIGQLMQGKRINAAAFLEETKIQRNRELRIKQINETNLKANLGAILDVEAQPKTQDVKGVKELREKIQEKIQSNLSKQEKEQLQKLKKQYDSLEKKLQQTKLKKAQEKEIDLDLIDKDKKLIPFIAKLNSLNKKIQVLEDRGENNLIRNFIIEQKKIREKGSPVSSETMGKLEQLRTIYSNPDAFEIRQGQLKPRANQVNLNPISDVEQLLRNSNTELRSIGKQDVSQAGFNPVANLDSFEIKLESSLIKTVDTDDIVALEKQIDEISEEFSAIEEIGKKQFPILEKYSNKIDSELKIIDEEINKTNELKKAARAGVSCIIKKGL
ncbi:MAG TPA: hypothetical protein VMZ91_05320 [Candidatus Paceibacterota bacterium]|nr:hypothetical protein [Candidatus Paceibacterota bacterium]